MLRMACGRCGRLSCIVGREEEDKVEKTCNCCGTDRYEEKKIEYLYSHDGEYLIVPNTPVEVCENCGMVYYQASVLKEIERRFFAIREEVEQPDRYIQVSAKALA